jgi:hypothetical protein
VPKGHTGVLKYADTYLVRHHQLEALRAGLLKLDPVSTKKGVNILDDASSDTPTGQVDAIAGSAREAERPPGSV